MSWDIHLPKVPENDNGNLPPEKIIVILPPQKIPLAKNRCLQEGNGAENTKENSRLVAKKPTTKENTSAVIKCFSSTLCKILKFANICSMLVWYDLLV